MGIALYFLKKYRSAFEYLQQAVNTFKFNANIWHLLGLCCVKLYNQNTFLQAQQQQNDLHTKLISYPTPNDSDETSDPQCAFKRILLPKIRAPYSATDDNMSLFHAREYFNNVLYTIGIWKTFFSDKRAVFESKIKEEKKVGGSTASHHQQSVVKLETLINLVYVSLVLEDSQGALTYLNQIEEEKFELDNDKQFTLRLYRAEALFMQQNCKESHKTLKSISSMEGSATVEYSSTIGCFQTFPKKMVTLYNQATMDLINGNLDNAKNKLDEISKILNNVAPEEKKEIPSCVLLSYIYYFIRKGDHRQALEYIKRRKYHPEMFNSKGTGSLYNLAY